MLFLSPADKADLFLCHTHSHSYYFSCPPYLYISPWISHLICFEPAPKSKSNIPRLTSLYTRRYGTEASDLSACDHLESVNEIKTHQTPQAVIGRSSGLGRRDGMEKWSKGDTRGDALLICVLHIQTDALQSCWLWHFVQLEKAPSLL